MSKSFAIIGLFVAVCAGSAFAKKEAAPIVLCQSGAFSGASSHFSRQAWLGSQTYFDEVNRQGGVNGHKIVLKYFDDQYDPDQAEKITNECLKDKNLFALYDYFGSSPVAKSLPVLQKAREGGSQVFMFANLTGAQAQRTPPFSPFVYNLRASYAEETQLLADRFIALGKKKFGMFIQNDGFGKSGLDGLKAALKKANLDVAVVTEYSKGALVTESFKDQAKKLKDTDVVISIATYQAAAGLIRDLRDSGYKGPVGHVSFVGAFDVLEMLKKLSAEGKKDYTKDIFVSLAYSPTTETSIPVVAEYLKASKEHPAQVPEELAKAEAIKPISQFGLEGYVVAKTFTEILKKSKKTASPAEFMKVADGGFTLDLGMAHPLQFSANEHQAIHDLYFAEVVNQEYHVSK